jgi:hypothetical protein
MAEGEERPLLGKGDEGDDTVDKQQEFFDLTSMALQVSLATFTRIALTSIDSAFLGHLGTQELAAASLAQVWTSVPLMGVVCARPFLFLPPFFLQSSTGIMEQSIVGGFVFCPCNGAHH